MKESEITSVLHLVGPDGFLERPVQSSDWAAPDAVEIRDGNLCYCIRHDSDARRVTPGRGMLEGFVKLERGSETDILRYARKWGRLEVYHAPGSGKGRPEWFTTSSAIRKGMTSLVFSQLGTGDAYSRFGFPCEADALPGKPGDHSLRLRRLVGELIAEVDRRCASKPTANPPRDPHNVQTDRRAGFEPLSTWRFWIRKVSSALRIASVLNDQKPPSREDWEEVMNSDEHLYLIARLGLIRAYDRKHFRLDRARIAFFSVLRQWQDIAALGFSLNPFNKGLQVTTDCLFAGLVWQVLSCVCGSGGFGICSECGSFYPPRRRPRSDTKNYCLNCGRRVAVRNNVRAWRLRRQQRVAQG